MIKIHIFHDHCIRQDEGTYGSRVLESLARIETLLQAQGRGLMTVKEEVAALIQAFNDSTNAEAAQATRIQAKLDDVLAKLAAASGGLTAAEVADVKAQLTAASDAQKVVVANLEKIGADAANPTPGGDPVVL